MIQCASMSRMDGRNLNPEDLLGHSPILPGDARHSEYYKISSYHHWPASRVVGVLCPECIGDAPTDCICDGRGMIKTDEIASTYELEVLSK